MFKNTLLILFFAAAPLFAQIKVQVGADLLLSKHEDLVKNKRLGLIVNQTSILSDSTHLLDNLVVNGMNVSVIFSPEHGFRGDVSRGASVENIIDKKTGIPIISLYGKTKKPTTEMLDGIDLLIFDIQDTGTRFYTYISTLYYVIQSSIENDVPLIVLDRPNPIGGIKVEGPVIDKELLSFVGIAQIPIKYGMTTGELANYFNDLLSTGYKKKADLTIIKMNGWKRNYYYDDCNLPWVKPSPNITDVCTAIAYPGMCFLEGTNVSEGRGTVSPFLIFGAPFIISENLLSELNEIGIPGVEFETIKFIPHSITEKAIRPKYEGEECSGLKLKITDREKFRPVRFGVILLHTLHKLYPGNFKFTGDNWIDKLYGNVNLRKMILDGDNFESILDLSKESTENFMKKRKQYLLY